MYLLSNLSGSICGIDDSDSIVLTGGYGSRVTARYNLQVYDKQLA